MSFVLPSIAEADIAWVCDLFGLPRSAFSGADGQDPRGAIIKCMDPLDVEACPGSGKTTTLVAKLAILARHWTARQKGICVLSHTNTARREVERRLSTTSEGQQLLSYPHYIGTIHGFANEYLALPWMRSCGMRIEQIDDEACLDWRWWHLPWNTRRALEGRDLSRNVLRYKNASFDLSPIQWGNGTLTKETDTYKAIRAVCEKSVVAGMYCYDELFVWACDLLDKAPLTVKWLRERFPIVFIDEVQDNNQAQAALLNRLFIAGDCPIVRQRFGDSNQAIFRFAGEKGAETDPFPLAAIRRDVPNSFRFGQSIADLSDSLALTPHGLKGHGGIGPNGEPDKAGRHAIFLFEDATIQDVLPAYARYLIDEFSEEELRAGHFTAVGAVHRHDKNDNLPRLVGHYWPSYDSGIGGAAPQPTLFLQYLAVGQRLSAASAQSFELVEKMAQGFLKLARLLNPQATTTLRKRHHRHVLDLLAGNDTATTSYLKVIRILCVERHQIAKTEWDGLWYSQIADIGMAIAKVQQLSDEGERFLGWSSSSRGDDPAAQKPVSDNLYRHVEGEASVVIRLGSIHSVKGETHTATLVLDTFFRTHHLRTLKPWLAGSKAGGQAENDTTKDRLKLHYVATTRASRLLCLAMRADALNNADIKKLTGRGWRIAHVQTEGVTWAA